MKHLKQSIGLLCVSFLILVGFSNAAHAQRFEASLSGGFLGLSSNSTQFDIGPGFFYQPSPSFAWLQLGGEITYQKLSDRGGSTKCMLVTAGPVFNLNGAILADSYFIGIGVAYKSGSSDVVDPTATDPNGVGFFLLFGRRINFNPTWGMRPSIGMVNAGSSGVVFKPIAISYRF